ncbi:hypothetical protein SUGI_0069900 [Cryptomeria japonica]|nr:hypothetical protein SUGI_0069900 [Cryptomeria japonica]
MDLATDVFIPEDYAKSRYSRKLWPKQQFATPPNVADAHSKNYLSSQKSENPQNMGGIFNREEIVLSCFTP